MIQLPCPEFTAMGYWRNPQGRQQYNNIFFRKHCRKELTTYVDMVSELKNNNNIPFRIFSTSLISTNLMKKNKENCFTQQYGRSFRENACIYLITCRKSVLFGCQRPDQHRRYFFAGIFGGSLL